MKSIFIFKYAGVGFDVLCLAARLLRHTYSLALPVRMPRNNAFFVNFTNFQITPWKSSQKRHFLIY